MPYFLILRDIKNICYDYAKTHLSFDEPIPDFESRYPGRLEAVIACPQIQVGGDFAYKTLPLQAAVLFYEMTKQHPFLNGNKRIACVSLLAFLSLNRKWLKTSWKELYDISIKVAKSKSENRDSVLKFLEEFIQNNTIENKLLMY